jgi:hypothetical protein
MPKPVVPDTKQAVLEGLRASLQLKMRDYFDAAMAADVLGPGQIQEFADGLAEDCARYETLVDTVNETLEVREEAATTPPRCIDTPYVSQTATTLSCTMGNWEGTPTRYDYQWQIDGAAVGTSSPEFTKRPEDDGKPAVCIVTAHNAAGSTAAPPSNEVIVGAARARP